MTGDDFSHQTIKSYQVRECIGSGGFGAVYRAFQPSVGREVAIKVILPQHANQPDFIRRFEVEAQLIAHLEHPHIVPLYDYWRGPEGAFLVMRWLPGNLRGALKKGPWSPEAAARLLDQIGSALALAHREGIVHRDIKPDNILLDEDDNAYLADFGIAKDTNVGTQTEEGTLVGSPAYITPEQIRGEPITPRADIYTLGLVLYETLAGERPYADAVTPVELISRHLNTPLPPLPNHRATLPVTLNEVLQTATAKDPNHRYATTQRFAASFRAALPNLQRMVGQPLLEPLTDRELEILRLMSDGLSNAEIVERLVLTTGTVKWYVNRIYAKLDVHSRRQAIERARQLGLFQQAATASTELLAATVVPSIQSSRVNRGRTDDALPSLEPTANPYKGLRAFQETDAADFFGRAALTEQLLARLAEDREGARFLAIAGPSGSGKSSVVRAGLIPALRRGALPHSDGWFITDMLPGTHPLEELEAALLRVSVSPLPGLRDVLAEDRRGLVRAAKRILPGDMDVELVLVIDQFEELFTLIDDEAVRSHFIDNLLSAATDPRSRVRIILTLRADFYDRPLNYPRLAELMRSHTEILLPMTTSELERAIAGPAERLGLRFETGLVAAMIADVNAQPGALPLLQYALTELFERRQDALLTMNTYRDSGGLAGALARRAEELFDDLEADGQAAARQIFLRLVTPGDETEDTRRRVLQAELQAGIADSRAVDEVLALFGRYRLLTFDRDPLTHAPTVEVAHEALIREWARLREWLADSREELRIQRRLQAAVNDWLAANQEPSFLAAGTRLTHFEALAESGKLVLNTDEQAYLSASIAERERLSEQEAARQARELDLAHQAASSAEKAETAQRTSANRLRWLVGALGGFLILALGLSTFAFNQRSDAMAQKQAAQDNAATATFAQGQALNNAATAVANLNIANGQRLAAAANTLLPGSTTNAEIAALLSIRSLQAGYSPQADIALQNANELLFTQKIWPGKVGWNNDVAYSPDGKSLLIVGPDGINLCDIASDCRSRTAFAPLPGVDRAAYLPDRHHLIGETDSGQIGMWNGDTGALEHQFKTGITRRSNFDWTGAPDLQVSADGKYLLIGTFNEDMTENTLYLWDIAQEKELHRWTTDGGYPRDAFSPDGKYITIVNGTSVDVWQPDGSRPDRQLTGPKAAIRSVMISPDSRLVLAGGEDGTAYVWDLTSGQELHRLTGHTGPIEQVLFSPDGKYVLTASIDKTARLWETATGLEVRRFTGHRGAVYRAAFAPDGRQVVTSSDDGYIRFWTTDLASSPEILIDHDGGTCGLAVSPDGMHLFTSSCNGQSGTLWRLSPLQPIKIVSTVETFSNFSNIGTIAITAFPTDNDHATVTILNGSDGQMLSAFTMPVPPGHPGVFGDLSPDGQWVAAIGVDKSAIPIYKANTGQEVTKLSSRITDWSINSRFSPDSKALLTTFFNSDIKLWDLGSGQAVMKFGELPQGKFANFDEPIFGLSLSPDGTRVAVGRSGIATLFDRATGNFLRDLVHSTSGGGVYAEFSPDGKMLVIGGYDGRLDIWNPANGQRLRIFQGHSGGSYGQFSADGKLIYSSGNDGVIRQWYVDYHDLIASVCQHIFRDLDSQDRTTYDITGKDPTCPTVAIKVTPAAVGGS